MPRERVGYFRVVVRRNGEWSLGPVRRSMKVKEAFDPVVYLREGIGFPRVIVRLPFSSVQEIFRRMGNDQRLVSRFEFAMNALLDVLREIDEKYGDMGRIEEGETDG